ncbi:unnamed protein product [Gordionus sp. m RMFG-2023]|uniref:brahma-associated protein of 60 kDa-like isoform X2 n=1 Tax=Gordionus sp. m RMFG-2023 TaxID=3053472 RepID=UPI0030E5C170
MDDMRKQIIKILKEGDLAQLSAKKVRQTLEEIYGQDLTYKKKEIDAMLMETLEEMELNDHSHATEYKDKSAILDKNITYNGKISDNKPTYSTEVSSDQLSLNEDSSFASDGDDSHNKQYKPKQKFKEIYNNDKVEDDEIIARRIQEEENSTRLRTRRTVKLKKHQTKKTKTKFDNDDQKKRKSGTSLYSRPCRLSPLLADLMGNNQMPRKDVVKRMWEIIKERNLQDPKNKQYALCDEQLAKIFGRKKIRIFGMMKHLSNQIIDNK